MRFALPEAVGYMAILSGVLISVLVFLGLYITTRYRSDKRPARQSIWFDLEEINLPAADKFTFFLLIKPVPTGAFAKINALFQHC